MTSYFCPSIDENTAADLLKSISIPPRPSLLVEINRILDGSGDLTKLSEVIAKDVAISASVLKTVNSPAFGLRSKISNIKQAVQLLGANNVRNIVSGLVLRSTLSGSAEMSLERFWDSSEKVANIAAHICTVLPRAPRDEAYTFGIFRDCGIPMLMQRFPDYRETLGKAAGDDRPLPMVEDEHHGTNHVVLGYMVAKSWGLSPTLCDALLRHHDTTIFQPSDTTSPTSRTLVAINYLAEHLNETTIRMRDDNQWALMGEATLAHLGLTHHELEELREDVANLFA